MKFDILPTGMHETGRKATRQGDDIDTDVRMLLDALDEAWLASDAPVAGALTRLSGDVQQKTGIMSSRVTRTVDGAAEATGIFDDGDHEMRGNANQGIDRANSTGNGWLGPGVR